MCLLTELDMEDAPLGISAAPMGATLAAKAGFEEVTVVKIEKGVIRTVVPASDIGDVVLWVALRQPLRPLSDGSASSDSSAPES
jgi:hypothetical protein